MSRAMCVVGVAALAATLAGSGRSAPSRARSGRGTVLLTLASHDDAYAGASYAAAVARLSHGSIRVLVANQWRDHEIDFERGIVADVRRGNAELGIVGVRVWDTVGVPDFRALVAPFLIDSLPLEGQVVQSPRATDALAGVARAGVVGLAVLPGVLRRPLGVTRELVGPQDYQGATIGIATGGVAAASFAALGGKAKHYPPASRAGLDGAELDMTTIAEDRYDLSARALTANVVLWARIQTVIINPKAYHALSPAQRQILVHAGRAALAPELARIRHQESSATTLVCTRGSLELVTASPNDLAGLQRAVQPVYCDLDRDARTRAWIADIRHTRKRLGSRPDDVKCP
jgi:TRAP-type C4-dicarboxylate transport system substrate-binding protein